MKKILLLLIGALFATGAVAQTTWGMKFGVNGGMITNATALFNNNDQVAYLVTDHMNRFNEYCLPGLDPITGEPIIDDESCNGYESILYSKSRVLPKVSFHAGLYVEHKFNRKLALRAEVVYSRQGALYRNVIKNRSRNDRKDMRMSARMKMNYINVPILMKYYLSDRFSIDLGPQFGFNVNSKFKIKNTTHNNIVKYYEEDIPVEKFDIALAIGASYKFAYVWDLSVRNNFSLTSGINIAGPALQMNTVQIGIGRRF